MTPRTIVVPGDGTASLALTLAPGLLQYVQAVYIEADAGSGDTHATLTVSEQSGVVIAKKRQGVPIPGGDTGSATWALRLDDEDSGTVALPAAYGIYNRTSPGGIPAVPAGGISVLPFNQLWHNGAPSVFTTTTVPPGYVTGISAGAGVYQLFAAISWVNTAFSKEAVLLTPGIHPYYTDLNFTSGSSQSATAKLVWTASTVYQDAAWGFTQLEAINHSGGAQDVAMGFFGVVKLA